MSLLRLRGAIVAPPTLQMLALDVSSAADDVAAGTTLANILNSTASSVITTADTRFSVSGTLLKRGSASWSDGLTSVALVETLSGATGSPKTTTIPFTVNSTSVPASVSTPVQGTDLTTIWNLQFSGTGPRSGATNGTWAGSLDAYLLGNGFITSNHDGAIYLNVGSGSVTISNYDFTSCPSITLNGTGSITFNDCVFPNVGSFLGNSITSPTDINGNTNITTGTLNVTCNYCLFNIGTFFVGSGIWSNNYCKFSNAVQQIGGCSSASLSFDHCYIPGGGCNPPAGSHVELVQFNSPPGQTLNITNCMIDAHANGQATVSPTSPNYGWTAIWSTTAPANDNGSWLIQNTIIIGITEVNNSSVNPNRIGTSFWYSQGTSVTIDNCVLEYATGAPGGYSGNGNGGASRPTVSGNRTFGNVALTSADFN